MKFKYVGEDNCFCIELLAYKLVEKGSCLKKGQVVEVPDNLANVIRALDGNGVFERVQEKKVIKKDKEDK